MSERFSSHKNEGRVIDVENDPFAFNENFDPNNPEHFTAWLNMRPSHLSEGEWSFALGELKLMLLNDSNRTEKEKGYLILGWKSKYGLLPKE